MIVDPGSCLLPPLPASGKSISRSLASADRAYIVIFDSLGGERTSTFDTLHQWLSCEAVNHGHRITRPAVHLPAVVPRQTNGYDCGLYALHFMERFMRDPTRLISILLVRFFVSKLRHSDVCFRTSLIHRTAMMTPAARRGITSVP